VTICFGAASKASPNKKRGEAGWLRLAGNSKSIALLAWAPIAVSTASATAATATITATTTASTATVSPAAAPGALFTRTGFRHRDIAAIHILSVQCADRGLRLFRFGHGNESETTRTSRHTVRNEVHIFDNAMRGKKVLQAQFRGIEGKISDEKFVVHDDYCLD
jgi:hypothetical protein